jgi:hypothetical protein
MWVVKIKSVTMTQGANRDQVMQNALSEIRKLDEEEARRMLQKQVDEETPAFGAEPWRKSRPSRLEQLRDAVTGQLSMTILSQQWSSVVSAVSSFPFYPVSKWFCCDVVL